MAWQLSAAHQQRLRGSALASAASALPAAYRRQAGTESYRVAACLPTATSGGGQASLRALGAAYHDRPARHCDRGRAARLPAAAVTRGDNELDGPAGDELGVSSPYQRDPWDGERGSERRETGGGASGGTGGIGADWTREAAEALGSGPLWQPLSAGVDPVCVRTPLAASQQRPPPDTQQHTGEFRTTAAGGDDPSMSAAIRHVSSGDIGATSGATDDWSDRAAAAAIPYGDSGGGSGGGDSGTGGDGGLDTR